MRCPHCHLDSAVVDSRLQANGTIRRRRVCPGQHRFWTWESTIDPVAALERRRKRALLEKARRDSQPRDVRAAEEHRKYLRKQARQEARQSGVPVEVLYGQFGVD